MRKIIAAGNWKMNTVLTEGIELASIIDDYVANISLKDNNEVILGVPFTHLYNIQELIDSKHVFVAAQNCSQFEDGAYTGEISVKMIKALGVKYIIIGHSERRQYFGDTDEIIAQKMAECHKNDVSPIFCCGEKLEEREESRHFEVVESQIKNAFKDISSEEVKNSIIAYEPVWAIGTGKTASPAQAQEMHMFIRKTFSELYSPEIAENLSILYGGSVKASNSKELFSSKDIDGGLVGGASLKADEFTEIINNLI